MFKQDKEERSGLSRLAQGLNQDALRYQNASDMVERLTTNANKRLAMAARDFANTCLVPMVKYSIELAQENDTRSYPMELAGQWSMVSPQMWQDEASDCEVAYALTPDEGSRLAQTLLMMHNQMTTMSNNPQAPDQDIQMLYGIQQKHAVLDDTYEALGVPDASRYLLSPNTPEFAEKMNEQMQQMQQMMQRQAEEQQFQRGLLTNEQNRRWAETQIEVADKTTDNDRADEQFEHERVVDFARLDIERRKISGQGT